MYKGESLAVKRERKKNREKQRDRERRNRFGEMLAYIILTDHMHIPLCHVFKLL